MSCTPIGVHGWLAIPKGHRRIKTRGGLRIVEVFFSVSIGYRRMKKMSKKKAHKPEPYTPSYQMSLTGSMAVTFPEVGIEITPSKMTFGNGLHFRLAGFPVNADWDKDDKIFALVESDDGTAPLFTSNSLVKQFDAIARDWANNGASWQASSMSDNDIVLDEIEIDSEESITVKLQKAAGQFGTWFLA